MGVGGTSHLTVSYESRIYLTKTMRVWNVLKNKNRKKRKKDGLTEISSNELKFFEDMFYIRFITERL